MWGNHLFGRFSPEKLKKMIPPHRGPGKEPRCGAPGSKKDPRQPRCGGMTFSAASALKKIKKVIRLHRVPGGSGTSPDVGESPFQQFQP